MQPTQCKKCKGFPTLRWFAHENKWQASCDEASHPHAKGRNLFEAVKKWNKMQAKLARKETLNPLNGGGER